MAASHSKQGMAITPQLISLPKDSEDESCVSSCVMAYISAEGDFRFDCQFKSPSERASLILHLEVALEHLRSRLSSQITSSLNLAA
jgi:hypothetical protein